MIFKIYKMRRPKVQKMLKTLFDGSSIEMKIDKISNLDDDLLIQLIEQCTFFTKISMYIKVCDC